MSSATTTAAAAAGSALSPAELVKRILRITEEKVVPLTAEGVASGSKVFGAAILSRDSGEPLTVATNNERVSPLLHGEINCIQQFFGVGSGSGSGADAAAPAGARPHPRDCIFFCTHEPCSLCLSGITWAGFDTFYYLFTYEDSRDLFAIPYDIDILASVFRVAAPSDTAESLAARPLYNKTNKFFKSASLADLVEQIEDAAEKQTCAAELARVKALYLALSETYQAGKQAGTETASVWK